MARVLITGAAGQLGTDLVHAAGARSLQIEALTSADLDITDERAVAALVSDRRPDAIINCAAWTAVDDCESDPDRALRVNGGAVSHLVTAADAVDAHLVQVSTDYVFSGAKADPYIESDGPDPASAYGRSKLAGEVAALGSDGGHSVVRISWVSGEFGNNMVKTVLRLAAEHETLRFVDDQHGNPCFTADLAPRLLDFALERPGGIIHLTNHGATTWHGFAQAVLAADGQDPDRVQPVATADLLPLRPAPRPANSILENRAITERGLGPLLRPWTEPLAELVARLRST